MKRLIAGLVTATILICLIGCGKGTEEVKEPSTMGEGLVQTFEKEIASTTDMEAICKTMTGQIAYDCDVFQIQEGYLNGFSDTVSGFNSGYGFAPFIGSIPFIAYIFETDDPSDLEETLANLADPRWNICTEAAETVIKISGNYVFFAMCPGEEEE